MSRYGAIPQQAQDLRNKTNLERLNWFNDRYSPTRNQSWCLRWQHDKEAQYNSQKAAYWCCCASNQNDISWLKADGGRLLVGFWILCCYSIRYCPQDTCWRTKNCMGLFKDAWSDHRDGGSADKFDYYANGACKEVILIKYEQDGYAGLQGNDDDSKYDGPPHQQMS